MTDKEPIGCGISKYWQTGENDPFYEACRWHDAQYDERRAGRLGKKTGKAVDKIFLEQMLALAEGRKLLKARAYLYYALARAWGRFMW